MATTGGTEMCQNLPVVGTGRWAVGLAATWCVLLAGGVARAQPCPVVYPSTGAPTGTFTPGEFYFRDNGTPSLLLGTNPTGRLSDFRTLLGQASVNERIVRIHLSVPSNPPAAGQIDCAWAQFWDQVFSVAEQNGLYVLPVLDVWAAWNVDRRAWQSNPFNAANGGPFTNPADLLVAGPNQDLWLNWLVTLVLRWQDRPNILGWEIFSELNLISDTTLGPGGQVTEAAAVQLAEAAAARVHAADSQGRPVSVSQAGGLFSYFANHWPTLATSSVEFVQIHPYAGNAPYFGNLDKLIIDSVRELRATYNKPVFIGEGGLDNLFPVDPANSLTVAPRASVGINQAIWAAAVSGAMNGRALWFEDGYDHNHDLCAYAQFSAYPECVDDDPATVLLLRTVYANASAPVASFLAGVDYSGFAPIRAVLGDDLVGAALGNTAVILGWVRDVVSAAPNWPSRLLSGQTVRVLAPGQSPDWLVTFYDTTTGGVLQSVYTTQQRNGNIIVALPDFSGSIAFQIRPASPVDVVNDTILGQVLPQRFLRAAER